jgi:SAM-dependent methyltransferase
MRAGHFSWSPESVRCNLCGNSDSAPLFHQDQHGLGLHTVMCRVCGLVYLNPRPRAADYDVFYRDWYHRMYPARAAFNAGKLGGRIAAECARLRSLAYSAFLGERPTLLEIGPGEGAFLRAVRAAHPDAQVRGVDLSPREAGACRRQGLDVLCGRLRDLPAAYSGNTHVALFHVLEHALDPVGLLREAAARLAPGGYVFVEVPNILGSWRGLGMLHVAHPYQFAPATLSRALAAAGFELVQLQILETALLASSLRAVARLGGCAPAAPVPATPGVEEMRRLFAAKLRGWRLQLLAAAFKRRLAARVGPERAARLWERTAGRGWERLLHPSHSPSGDTAPAR